MPNLTADKRQIIEEIFNKQEVNMGLTLSREQGEPLYAINEAVADSIVAQNNAVLASWLKMAELFRSMEAGAINYNNGTVVGLRAKMLSSSHILDFKQYVTKVTIETESGSQIVTKSVENVVYIDEDITDEEELQEIYLQIGNNFVNYADVGTFQEAVADDDEAITVTANANNGQEVDYSFSLAKPIEVELMVSYSVDAQEEIPFNLTEAIYNAVNDVISQTYTNNIGKNLNTQDFTSIMRKISGIGSLNISFTSDGAGGFANDGNSAVMQYTVGKQYFLHFNFDVSNINRG